MQSGLRILSLLVCATTFSFASADHPPSGQRQALLVGNASYEGDDLQGITASLDTLEEVLAPRGYHVTRKENLAGEDFKKTFDAFVQSVPTNGIALFYYAGRSGYLDRLGKPHVLLRPAKTKLGNDGDYRKFKLNLPEAVQTLRLPPGPPRPALHRRRPPRVEPRPNASRLAAFEVGTEVALVYAATASKRTKPLRATPPRPSSGPSPSTSTKRTLSRRLRSYRTETAPRRRQAATVVRRRPRHLRARRGLAFQTPARQTSPNGQAPREAYANPPAWSSLVSARLFHHGLQQPDGPATRDRKPVQVTLQFDGRVRSHPTRIRQVLRKNPPLTFTRHKNAPFRQDAKIVSTSAKS